MTDERKNLKIAPDTNTNERGIDTLEVTTEELKAL